MDACCLSRLTDDQSQPRIRLESHAIEQILVQIRIGVHQLVSSEPLDAEVRSNPSADRRLEAMAILEFATARLTLNQTSIHRAQVLNALGYGPFDALHLAAAESGEVDIFFTTDDRLINKAARRLGSPRIQVRNPLSWIQEAK